MNVFDQETANGKLAIAFIWKHRITLVIAIIIGAVGAAGVTYFIKPEYRSTGIIFPTNSNKLESVMANPQFGFDLDADRLMQILESRQVQDAVVEKFNLAKEEIVKAVSNGVKHFDVQRQTCLATDWSKAGIGFFLLQKWCDCSEIHPRCCPDGWRLVLAGGRFTKPAESRYSPVEGELLAVADALHKTRHFVLGCDKLVVAVDHKPLLGLLNDKSLADIENPRLLMLKENQI